ncbi:MAG TPA: VWA domain-containing protein [Bryobacteraceae bacterium]|nr:VWA domain-containing protein [Bryobacteraceae bacterium]
MKPTLFLCVVGLLAAQDPPKDPAKEAPTKSDIIVSFKFVLAPVTVVDRNHDFVPGLTPYDFRLYDNGKLQKITEDIANHPLSVVLVIQANADVEKILPSIQRTASLFESLVIGEEGEVAVIGFDHRTQVLTDFTNDAAAIDIAFKKLRPGSYTAALNDATMKGINMLRTRPQARKRVLIQIAENRDKGSEIKPREVLTEADFQNVSMYSVNISQLLAALTSKAQPNRPSTLPPGAEYLPGGQINTASTESQMNMGNWVPALKDIFDAAKGVFLPDPLDIYTKYTGGHECGFKGDKGLQTCIQKIGDELHSQYMLTYLPNNQEEGGFHHIVVEVVKPGLSVRTRDGYWVAARPK